MAKKRSYDEMSSADALSSSAAVVVNVNPVPVKKSMPEVRKDLFIMVQNMLEVQRVKISKLRVAVTCNGTVLSTK